VSFSVGSQGKSTKKAEKNNQNDQESFDGIKLLGMVSIATYQFVRFPLVLYIFEKVFLTSRTGL